jgi:hypothetical protein
MLQLFGALPDQVSGSRTDAGQRPRNNLGPEFVAGNAERSFSIDPVPIRERTALNVGGDDLVCLAHRVRAEVGNAPLHDGLVFLWSSRHAIVGCEFGKIRTGDDDRKMTVGIERLLALRIGTIKIRFLAVLLKRDGNQRPRPHKPVYYRVDIGQEFPEQQGTPKLRPGLMKATSSKCSACSSKKHPPSRRSVAQPHNHPKRWIRPLRLV